MKRMLILLALSAPIAAYAAPASNIAWTPEQLNFVKKGDPAKGKELAATCGVCHGEKGEGMPGDEGSKMAYPALAGQGANYTFKQLRDYAGGQRTDDIMTATAKGLSEQDAADLAVWFAALPKPQVSAPKVIASERAAKMVADGDGKRILPPCFVCHGAKGLGEKMDIPALAGQQTEYFVKTLLEYKNGTRHNDIYSRMRLIAQQLSEEEIKELAVFYQNLR